MPTLRLHPLCIAAALALVACAGAPDDDLQATHAEARHCPGGECDPPPDDPPPDDPPPEEPQDPACSATLCTASASCQNTACDGGCYDRGFACSVGTCSLYSCDTASFSGQSAYPWRADTFCTDAATQAVTTCRAWTDAGGADCESFCSAASSCSDFNRCVDGATGQRSSCRAFGECDLGACATTCSPASNCAQPCVAGGGLGTTCGAMGLTCDAGIACSACTWNSAPATQCTVGGSLSTCGQSGRSTRPVAGLVMSLSSGKRRLVHGWDGGHHSLFCPTKDAPLYACYAPYVSFDGLQLRPDPSGAHSPPSGLPPVTRVAVNAVNGPYQKSGDGKWEWKEGTTGDWTHRRYDLVQLDFGAFDARAAFPNTGHIWIHWDEDDGLNDDDFDWMAPISVHLAACLANARAPGVWTTVDTDRVVSNHWNGYLCDSRGCEDGEYEVRYDVQCSWRY